MYVMTKLSQQVNVKDVALVQQKIYKLSYHKVLLNYKRRNTRYICHT